MAFIEFRPTPHRRFGYAFTQLLHYQLLPRDPSHDPTAMPQVLTLGFATADVVLSGKRLEAVAEFLAEGQLKSVAALPERFAELDPTKPSSPGSTSNRFASRHSREGGVGEGFMPPRTNCKV